MSTGTGDREVLYPDGSRSTFFEGGGAFHDGGDSIQRLRLITAMQALRVYLESDGRWQLTRNGAQNAIKNVIEPATGKTYKRSKNGKNEAYRDVIQLLNELEMAAVVYDNDKETPCQ